MALALQGPFQPAKEDLPSKKHAATLNASLPLSVPSPDSELPDVTGRKRRRGEVATSQSDEDSSLSVLEVCPLTDIASHLQIPSALATYVAHRPEFAKVQTWLHPLTQEQLQDDSSVLLRSLHLSQIFMERTGRGHRLTITEGCHPQLEHDFYCNLARGDSQTTSTTMKSFIQQWGMSDIPPDGGLYASLKNVAIIFAAVWSVAAAEVPAASRETADPLVSKLPVTLRQHLEPLLSACDNLLRLLTEFKAFWNQASSVCITLYQTADALHRRTDTARMVIDRVIERQAEQDHRKLELDDALEAAAVAETMRAYNLPASTAELSASDVLTVCLDLIQSGDKQVESLMEERRQLVNALKEDEQRVELLHAIGGSAIYLEGLCRLSVEIIDELTATHIAEDRAAVLLAAAKVDASFVACMSAYADHVGRHFRSTAEVYARLQQVEVQAAQHRAAFGGSAPSISDAINSAASALRAEIQLLDKQVEGFHQIPLLLGRAVEPLPLELRKTICTRLQQTVTHLRDPLGSAPTEQYQDVLFDKLAAALEAMNRYGSYQLNYAAIQSMKSAVQLNPSLGAHASTHMELAVSEHMQNWCSQLLRQVAGSKSTTASANSLFDTTSVLGALPQFATENYSATLLETYEGTPQVKRARVQSDDQVEPVREADVDASSGADHSPVCSTPDSADDHSSDSEVSSQRSGPICVIM
jgi:Rod binding domain-containing protein